MRTSAPQASFIEPEVLKIGGAKIDQFLAAEPRLKVYAFYLHDIVRRAPHTLSDAEEKILADAGPLAGSASNIYNILANADFPYPRVKFSDREIKVDQANYGAMRTSPNREDRKLAMSSFFTALGAFSRTFGTTMNSEVQKVRFYAKARKYGSDLEMSLDGPNIPTSVYTRLIDGVNKNLPTFHRYLRLRKKMMGHHRPAALLRPLRAAGQRGQPEIHARGSAEARARGGHAARSRLHAPSCSGRSTSAGSTSIRPRASSRARTRTAAPTTCTRSCC